MISINSIPLQSKREVICIIKIQLVATMRGVQVSRIWFNWHHLRKNTNDVKTS